jgi:hypothetical protein
MYRLRALISEEEEHQRGVTLGEMRRLRSVKLPRWLYQMVGVMIAGYHDRESAIAARDTPAEVREEYMRINHTIDGAVEAACFGYDADVIETMREDLIRDNGWRRSPSSAIFGERTFYRIKKLCYVYLAARLYLI